MCGSSFCYTTDQIFDSSISKELSCFQSMAAKASMQMVAELFWKSSLVRGEIVRPQGLRPPRQYPGPHRVPPRSFHPETCPGWKASCGSQDSHDAHAGSLCPDQTCVAASTLKQQQSRLSLEVLCTSLGNVIQCFGGNLPFLYLQKCFPSGSAVHWSNPCSPLFCGGNESSSEKVSVGITLAPGLPALGLFDNF